MHFSTTLSILAIVSLFNLRYSGWYTVKKKIKERLIIDEIKDRLGWGGDQTQVNQLQSCCPHANERTQQPGLGNIGVVGRRF